MDPFVIALVVVALADSGGRVQLLAAILGQRFATDPRALAGLLLATLLNATLAALAGAAVGRAIAGPALGLFAAIAAIFAGTGMLLWRRATDPLTTWRSGPFATALLGIFSLQFGDKAQFLLVAIAAYGAWPFALGGGWLGSLAALLSAFLLRERLADVLPLAAIRRLAAVGFLCAGAVLAARAFRIL